MRTQDEMDTMSVAERRGEVSGILATGVLRLLLKEGPSGNVFDTIGKDSPDQGLQSAGTDGSLYSRLNNTDVLKN